ncbi:hypothetical protein EON80_00075 [bacterium]|nr:MAG: hypothetical protein EON80_00075 [bacterium]
MSNEIPEPVEAAEVRPEGATETKATADATASSSSAPEPIVKAAEDLTFPSETDAPFTPFFWKSDSSETISAEIVAENSGRAVSEIKSQSLAALFRPLVAEEDWHNEEEKEAVRQYKTLFEALKTSLENVKVFRIGKVEIDIYVVGTVTGGYSGLKTQAVET